MEVSHFIAKQLIKERGWTDCYWKTSARSGHLLWYLFRKDLLHCLRITDRGVFLLDIVSYVKAEETDGLMYFQKLCEDKQNCTHVPFLESGHAERPLSLLYPLRRCRAYDRTVPC